MDKARKRKAAHTGRPPNEQLTNNDSSILASQLGSSISESLLPSQRVVRQRALLSSDLPRPESSTAAETRKKRKAAIASGRQEENSGPPLHNRHRRLRVLIENNSEGYENHTHNVVYTEIFNDLTSRSNY
ncbi:uncharacterized protein LOC120649183 isoform X9 [Panicum virgatum]|uniref:uncharacterized protein LOC120649183 isoform X9 n=1 Tax=Panicum virgatum TaxID=38727 RepID=UPI0019D5377F|nr:uncharacterized protein LOC120649183 isoform X9 [Panicum virgatum]